MSEGADRLNASRQAIVQYVNRKERKQEKPAARDPSAQAAADMGTEPDDQDALAASWFGPLARAASAWWRHHPAHMALELATPTLSDFARRKPMQFLGIAVGAGVLLYVARPWRLVSATGMAMALIKSSRLSGLVMSAMSAAGDERDDPRQHR